MSETFTASPAEPAAYGERPDSPNVGVLTRQQMQWSADRRERQARAARRLRLITTPVRVARRARDAWLVLIGKAEIYVE